MVRSIVINPAKLAMASEAVEDINSDETRQIIDDLKDTAYHWQTQPIGCIGLAANQIGYLKRIVAVWFDGDWMILINPVVSPVKRSPVDHKREGCLSRPGIKSRKKRYKKIEVERTLLNGERVKVRYTGMTARVIQHEVDHLDGVFI